MDPTKFFRIKMLWDRFAANHPKFPRFLQAAAQSSIGEGTVIEVTITQPNGDTIASNLKVTAEDMELYYQIKDLAVKGQ